MQRTEFDRGFRAFSAAFPRIAERVTPPFYVCPLCLVAWPEEALRARWLTREDVPPKGVGGRKLVLTCKRCNDWSGHQLDWHARRESELVEFLTGGKTAFQAHLQSTSGRVPVTMTAENRNIEAVMVGHAAAPNQVESVQDDFGRAAEPEAWRDFEFKINFKAFSQSRAAASWLRSAYLAFFATLGYKFIFRPELDSVRARIRNPESTEPTPFRLVNREASPEPQLARVDEPAAFRSYLMRYGRNAIFLPRYGDQDLYSRLVAQPAGDVRFSGISYPWPKRPVFLHDVEITAASKDGAARRNV